MMSETETLEPKPACKPVAWWVAARGKCKANALQPLVEAYLQAHPDALYLAHYTDRLDSGFCRAQALTPPVQDVAHLLELRVFDETSELWLHRGSMTVIFAYRRAEDAGLPQCATQTLRTTQYLDIDRTKERGAPAQDSFGRAVHHTAAGGSYTLPTSAQATQCVTQVYLIENAYGALRQADWRMVGFAEQEQEGGNGIQ